MRAMVLYKVFESRMQHSEGFSNISTRDTYRTREKFAALDLNKSETELVIGAYPMDGG